MRPLLIGFISLSFVACALKASDEDAVSPVGRAELVEAFTSHPFDFSPDEARCAADSIIERQADNHVLAELVLGVSNPSPEASTLYRAVDEHCR